MTLTDINAITKAEFSINQATTNIQDFTCCNLPCYFASDLVLFVHFINRVATSWIFFTEKHCSQLFTPQLKKPRISPLLPTFLEQHICWMNSATLFFKWKLTRRDPGCHSPLADLGLGERLKTKPGCILLKVSWLPSKLYRRGQPSATFQPNLFQRPHS